MIAHHIHDALDQVRTMRALLLERTLFQGYSGVARILSGCLALATALAFQVGELPATPRAHLAGWAAVLIVAILMNYGALAYTFFFDARFKRDVTKLKPVADAIPPLIAGGLVSLALCQAGQYDMLFGIWMIFYSLSHLACRRTMPRENTWVGLFYFVAGVACLLLPGVSFVRPWPMAVVFFAGECAGGLVLMATRAALIRSLEGASS